LVASNFEHVLPVSSPNPPPGRWRRWPRNLRSRRASSTSTTCSTMTRCRVHPAGREQPYQPAGYNHLAQAILYRDMFRAVSLGERTGQRLEPVPARSKVDASPKTRQVRSGHWPAMELAQATLKRNPNDNAGAIRPLGSTGCGQLQLLVRKAWRGLPARRHLGAPVHSRVSELDPGFLDATARAGLARLHRGQLPPTGVSSVSWSGSTATRRGHPAAGAGRRKGPGQPHRRQILRAP